MLVTFILGSLPTLVLTCTFFVKIAPNPRLSSLLTPSISKSLTFQCSSIIRVLCLFHLLEISQNGGAEIPWAHLPSHRVFTGLSALPEWKQLKIRLTYEQYQSSGLPQCVSGRKILFLFWMLFHFSACFLAETEQWILLIEIPFLFFGDNFCCQIHLHLKVEWPRNRLSWVKLNITE